MNTISKNNQSQENREDIKPGWGWKLYLIFFSVLIVQSTIEFFTPGSVIDQFYVIFVAFDPSMGYIYFINAACVIVNDLSIIPIFLFVYRIKILKPSVWKWLIILRFALDICGHYYEYVFIKSVYHSSPITALKLVIPILVIVAPSYWACYSVAFRQHKIFAKQLYLFK